MWKTPENPFWYKEIQKMEMCSFTCLFLDGIAALYIAISYMPAEHRKNAILVVCVVYLWAAGQN